MPPLAGLRHTARLQTLDGWEANHPGRRQKMFSALMNGRPSHLLDENLFDFKGLRRNAEDDEPE